MSGTDEKGLFDLPYPDRRASPEWKDALLHYEEWETAFRSDWLDDAAEVRPELLNCANCGKTVGPVGVRKVDSPDFPNLPTLEARRFGPILVLRCWHCFRIAEMDLGPLIAAGKIPPLPLEAS